MAKFRPHIAFVSIMFSYIIIRFVRSHYDVNEFVQGHLTDLLFVPAMFCFTLIIMRWFKKDEHFLIAPWMLIVQTGLIAYYFEFYLPENGREGHIHISDWLDVLMYGIGCLVYLILQMTWFKLKRDGKTTLI